jgi:4-carboxymuconolactone decarboxylase
MGKLPEAFETFRKRYPSVYKAYEALGGAAHEAGPLDQKTRELVKLGMAIGGRLEGAVRSHAHRAREAGATPEELEQVILLAVTTSGFPTAVAAFSWVEELLAPRKRKTSRNT